MLSQSTLRYTLITTSGLIGEAVQGVTDARGATQLLQKDAMHIAHVQLRDST